MHQVGDASEGAERPLQWSFDQLGVYVRCKRDLLRHLRLIQAQRYWLRKEDFAVVFESLRCYVYVFSARHNEKAGDCLKESPQKREGMFQAHPEVGETD